VGYRFAALFCHARAWPGHPRLSGCSEDVGGRPSPAMTEGDEPATVARIVMPAFSHHRASVVLHQAAGYRLGLGITQPDATQIHPALNRPAATPRGIRATHHHAVLLSGPAEMRSYDPGRHDRLLCTHSRRCRSMRRFSKADDMPARHFRRQRVGSGAS